MIREEKSDDEVCLLHRKVHVPMPTLSTQKCHSKFRPNMTLFFGKKSTTCCTVALKGLTLFPRMVYHAHEKHFVSLAFVLGTVGTVGSSAQTQQNKNSAIKLEHVVGCSTKQHCSLSRRLRIDETSVLWGPKQCWGAPANLWHSRNQSKAQRRRRPIYPIAHHNIILEWSRMTVELSMSRLAQRCSVTSPRSRRRSHTAPLD